MELKEQIKGELLKQKEEKLKKEKELNSKLKEITVYSIVNEKFVVGKNLISYLKDNGINFQEKDISTYPEIRALIQVPAQIVVVVNNNYIVHGRDFQTPQQLVSILRFVASPDYVAPSDSNEFVIQSIKNLTQNINKQFQGLARTLQPVLKVMNDIQKELEEEKVENEQKNN